MTSQEAINAYRRVKTWERRESERLRNQILVPYFGGNLCCLHNWSLNYESGIPTITKDVYKLGKFYEWKKKQIWEQSTRLSDHFANFF